MTLNGAGRRGRAAEVDHDRGVAEYGDVPTLRREFRKLGCEHLHGCRRVVEADRNTLDAVVPVASVWVAMPPAPTSAPAMGCRVAALKTVPTIVAGGQTRMRSRSTVVRWFGRIVPLPDPGQYPSRLEKGLASTVTKRSSPGNGSTSEVNSYVPSVCEAPGKIRSRVIGT